MNNEYLNKQKMSVNSTLIKMALLRPVEHEFALDPPLAFQKITTGIKKSEIAMRNSLTYVKSFLEVR